MSCVLLQQYSDIDQQSGSDGAVVQQDPGQAEVKNPGQTGAVVLPTELAPLAPDARSERLGLGSVGRSGLREIEQADVGLRGQSLAKYFESSSNPVGGYAVGVPLTVESVAVGPSTFIEHNDTMFRSGFEVRSYRSVDRWARLSRTGAVRPGACVRQQSAQGNRTGAGRTAVKWRPSGSLPGQSNGDLMHAREGVDGVVASAEDDVLQRLEAERVAAAVAALPDGQRRVLIMRDVQGYSGRAVVAALGLSTAAMKSLLHRDRSAVHQLLKEPTL